MHPLLATTSAFLRTTAARTLCLDLAEFALCRSRAAVRVRLQCAVCAAVMNQHEETDEGK